MELEHRPDPRRIRQTVERLAASPRHVVNDRLAAARAADFVAESLAALGLPVQAIPVADSGVTLPAVWATVPGARSADVFVLCAHYDTVRDSPGADDNASGVAVLLELARLLRAAAPRSDVVLAAVPFEEADIDGPHAPVAGAAALAARLCPARRVTGMVSIEMVGYATDAPDALGLGEGPADYVALVGDPRAADLIDSFVLASKEARGAARTLGAALDPSTTPDVYRSDHFAFAQLGVPAAMATDTANYRNPHYHQRTDLPDTIDYEFAAAVAASLLAGTLSYTARPR